jgi:hypothetical protein
MKYKFEDVLFGIPSYKRSGEQRTLEYLLGLGVPKKSIIMSVQTKEDSQLYHEAGWPKQVGRFIFREANNTAGNRNTILDSLPALSKILFMDDDVVGIDVLSDDELKPITERAEFETLVRLGFTYATKYKTIAWGVYPIRNAYFMSTKLKLRTLCNGYIFGMIQAGWRFDEQMNLKEDYELSCRIIKQFGNMPRLNCYVGNPGTKIHGGCEEYWKDDKLQKQAFDRLMLLHGDLLRPNPRRKYEVLMK